MRVHIPRPARSIVIEGKHPLVGKCRNELNGEERIATGLPVHQLRKRRGLRRLAAKSVRNQLPLNALAARGASVISCYLSAAGLDGVEPAPQRMCGIDLVVPISADQQQVPHLRVRDQVLEEVERRSVQPLQVIQEQRERVLRPGEHSEEAPDDQMKTRCASCGGTRGTGGCSPMMRASSGMRLTIN